jgi:large subunit ribosomal protein L18
MSIRTIRKNRRKERIRAKISGSIEKPRLAVNTSNKHVIAQIIDDIEGKTLVYASDKDKGFIPGKTKTESAYKVGVMIGEKADKLNLKKVVFDRGGKLYHGRVKALAEGARSKGLEF